MKKFLMLLVSFVMVLSAYAVVNANEVELISADLPLLIAPNNNSIKVMQDGEYVDFTDANGDRVEPQIINSRTMVPFRKIFNSLGVIDEDITWVADTRTVIAKKDNIEIELQIDNNVAKKTVSGETTEIKLDAAPVIYESRTLVPVRFIAESMEKLVGWDADNRTVVIIDMVKIQKELEEAMPTYFELMSLKSTPINTMDATMALTGEIAYTNKAEKANNSTLKFVAEIDVKKSETDVYVKVDLVFSGKGILYEAVKESGLTKLDLTLIMSGNKMYITSSLFEDEMKGKWLVMEDDSILELMNLLNAIYTDASMDKLLQVSEEALNIYTYEQLQLAINLIKEFLGEDNLKITGTKTKKYTLNIDILDMFKLVGELGADLDGIEVLKEVRLTGEGTLKDGVETNSSAELVFEMAEDGEEISMEIKAVSEINSYNKAVKINIPSAKDVISY